MCPVTISQITHHLTPRIHVFSCLINNRGFIEAIAADQTTRCLCCGGGSGGGSSGGSFSRAQGSSATAMGRRTILNGARRHTPGVHGCGIVNLGWNVLTVRAVDGVYGSGWSGCGGSDSRWTTHCSSVSWNTDVSASVEFFLRSATQASNSVTAHSITVACNPGM